MKLAKVEDPFESLEKRRTRTDLIETYKYLNNKYRTNPQNLFVRPHATNLRGHSSKLFIRHARTETRKNFFSFRVAQQWNRLDEKTVSAPTVSSFRRRVSVSNQPG